MSWEISLSTQSGPRIYDGETCIATIKTTSETGEEEMKRAHLLAAATDLLAVAKEFLLCGPNAGHNQDLIRQFHNAIQKAEPHAEQTTRL